MTSESDPLCFHQCIDFGLVVSGENPQGRGGTGRSFPGYEKSYEPPGGIFIVFFSYWCLSKIFPPFSHWILYLQLDFPLIFRFVCHIKTCILKIGCRILLKIDEPCFDLKIHPPMDFKIATLFISCEKPFSTHYTHERLC